MTKFQAPKPRNRHQRTRFRLLNTNPLAFALQEHMAKHSGDKPYKCDVCPKQFNHKTDLRRHMCLHTGEKPFTCETCGKGFIREDRMIKHADTHKKKAPMMIQ